MGEFQSGIGRVLGWTEWPVRAAAMVEMRGAMRSLAMALALMLPAAAAERGTQVLMLSDLHFDPLADTALVDRLVAAGPEEWTAILNTSGMTGFAGSGHDTNWPLMVSALNAMKAAVPNPAFAIVTGDLFPHRFKENFQKAATDKSDATYQAFVRKAARFLAMQLRERYPEMPIFTTPGNNDDDCGDYMARPGGPFFKDLLEVMSGLVGKESAGQFQTDWAASGSYWVQNPAVRGHRIVLANTVYFSPRYKNACGDASATPAADVLKWLKGTLEAARRAHEKVWLVYHVPPGVDGFATQRKLATAACADSIVPMWQEEYSAAFLALMTEYADTIVASFAGHTHMDDFRLMGGAAGYRAYTLINPAISPIFGQNPAFRTVLFRRGKPVDQSTYYLSDGVANRWTMEYSFRAAWGLRGMDLKDFETLYARIGSDERVRAQWLKYFAVSRTGPGSVTTATFKSVYCATGQSGLAEYQACFCAGK
jgi:sphingomyelin phosphodiesterase acid-like 3